MDGTIEPVRSFVRYTFNVAATVSTLLALLVAVAWVASQRATPFLVKRTATSDKTFAVTHGTLVAEMSWMSRPRPVYPETRLLLTPPLAAPNPANTPHEDLVSFGGFAAWSAVASAEDNNNYAVTITHRWLILPLWMPLVASLILPALAAPRVWAWLRRRRQRSARGFPVEPADSL